MINFFNPKFLILIFIIVFSNHTFAQFCSNSSLTFDSISSAGGGNFNIRVRLCVGGGILGGVSGAGGNTGRFLFSFSSSQPGFSVSAFTTPIVGDTTSINYNGVNVGAQPVFNATVAIFYNNTANWFTCVTSTVACGRPHVDCNLITFTTNGIPDSLRVYGIEGGDNLFGGCLMNSKMVIDFAAVLPVNLLHFDLKCKDDEVFLNWAAQSEHDIKKYTIEKSYDLQNFFPIGYIKAVSSQASASNYYYSDFISSNNWQTAYYRLAIEDYSGGFTFSPVIIANCSGLRDKFKVSYTANSGIQINSDLSEEGNYVCKVIDSKGGVVITRGFHLPVGFTENNLNYTLASGVYYILLMDKSTGFVYSNKILAGNY